MRPLFRYVLPPGSGPQSSEVVPNTGELKITLADFFGFFGMHLPDMFVAFALAGYEIPAIEIVLSDYNRLGGDNQLLSRWTFRFSCVPGEPVLAYTSRPARADDDPQWAIDPSQMGTMLRVYLEPLKVDGAPRAMAIDEAGIDAYLARLAPLVTEPLDTFFARRSIRHATGMRGGRKTVGQVFEANIRALATASSGVVNFGTYIDTSSVFADGAALKTEVFTALDALVVAPVAMYLSRFVGDAAAAWWSQPREGGLERAPGGLSILDPATWTDGTLLLNASSPPLGQKSASRIADYLRETMERVHASLSEPVGTVFPDRGLYTLGLQFSDYLANQSTATGTPPPSVDLSATSFPEPAWPSVLVQRLLFHCGNVGSSEPSGASPELLAAGGNDLTTILTLVRTVARASSFAAPKLRARRFRVRAEAVYRACGASRDVAERAANSCGEGQPFLLGVFDLFANGVFWSGAGADDEEEDDTEYDVLAYEVSATIVRLTLPGYSHYGIELRRLNANVGYELVRGVCWEYVPSQPLPSAGEMAAARQALDPNWDKPRLLIVAAPGIAVTKTEWPEETVPVEIYRVQDAELVPLHGERIAPELLTAPRALGLDDIVDDAAIAAIPGLAAVADTIRSDANPPMVVVKPLRSDEQGRQGVEIAYEGTASGPGISGSAIVRIRVHEASGQQRFAYDLTPTVIAESRPTGRMLRARDGSPYAEMKDVDVLRFRLVVYSTPDVEVYVEDTVVTVVWATALEHHYYIGGDIADIPPQGAALAYRDDEQAVRPQWMIASPDGTFARAEAKVALAHNAQPMNALLERFLIDWAKNLADVGLSMIPVVGDAADAAELLLSFYTGTDKWGRPVTAFDRGLMAAGVLLPVVSGSTLKTLKGAVKASNPTIPADWLKGVNGS